MTDPIATSTIISQAFRFMEKTPPSSLADDSEEAEAAAEQYPVAIEMCLEDSDWSFASVLVILSEAGLPQTSVADPELSYVYKLPSDCLTIREMPLGVLWRRDADLLRASAAGPLQVRYSRKITNENELPSTFRTAVSYTLAGLLAPRWMTTRTKVADLNANADAFLRRAKKNDRSQASSTRYDDLDDEGDWATGATL